MFSSVRTFKCTPPMNFCWISFAFNANERKKNQHKKDLFRLLLCIAGAGYDFESFFNIHLKAIQFKSNWIRSNLFICYFAFLEMLSMKRCWWRWWDLHDNGIGLWFSGSPFSRQCAHVIVIRTFDVRGVCHTLWLFRLFRELVIFFSSPPFVRCFCCIVSICLSVSVCSSSRWFVPYRREHNLF